MDNKNLTQTPQANNSNNPLNSDVIPPVGNNTPPQNQGNVIDPSILPNIDTNNINTASSNPQANLVNQDNVVQASNTVPVEQPPVIPVQPSVLIQQPTETNVQETDNVLQDQTNLITQNPLPNTNPLQKVAEVNLPSEVTISNELPTGNGSTLDDSSNLVTQLTDEIKSGVQDMGEVKVGEPIIKEKIYDQEVQSKSVIEPVTKTDSALDPIKDSANVPAENIPDKKVSEKLTSVGGSEDKDKSNKIIKFILLGILAIIILLVGYLVYNYFVNSSIAKSMQGIYVTNQTENAATIVWITEKKSKTELYYSTEDKWIPVIDFFTKKQAYDDRDVEEVDIGVYELESKGNYYVHSVTIRDLEPETKYYFKIKNGVFNINFDYLNTFTTYSIAEKVDSPNPIYGNVFDQQAYEVEDAIVFVRVRTSDTGGDDSQLLSAVLSDQRGWSIDIGNLRDIDGLSQLSVGANSVIRVEVLNPFDKEVVETTLEFAKPVSNITLTSENVYNIAQQKIVAIEKGESSYPYYVYKDYVSKVEAKPIMELECSNDSDCASGYKCNGGVCQKVSTGGGTTDTGTSGGSNDYEEEEPDEDKCEKICGNSICGGTVIDSCKCNDPCPGNKPICKTFGSRKLCVECGSDSDCRKDFFCDSNNTCKRKPVEEESASDNTGTGGGSVSPVNDDSEDSNDTGAQSGGKCSGTDKLSCVSDSDCIWVTPQKKCVLNCIGTDRTSCEKGQDGYVGWCSWNEYPGCGTGQCISNGLLYENYGSNGATFCREAGNDLPEPPKKCADLNCSADQKCVEGVNGKDAECVAVLTCADLNSGTDPQVTFWDQIFSPVKAETFTCKNDEKCVEGGGGKDAYCIKKNEPTQESANCTTINEPNKCRTKGCTWEGNACIQTPVQGGGTGNDGENTAEGITEAQCNKYTQFGEYDCPTESGCIWKINICSKNNNFTPPTTGTGGTSGSTEDTCGRYTNAGTCTAKPNCEWLADYGECVSVSGSANTSCVLIPNEPTCRSNQSCQWDPVSSICKNKSTSNYTGVGNDVPPFDCKLIGTGKTEAEVLSKEVDINIEGVSYNVSCDFSLYGCAVDVDREYLNDGYGTRYMCVNQSEVTAWNTSVISPYGFLTQGAYTPPGYSHGNFGGFCNVDIGAPVGTPISDLTVNAEHCEAKWDMNGDAVDLGCYIEIEAPGTRLSHLQATGEADCIANACSNPRTGDTGIGTGAHLDVASLDSRDCTGLTGADYDECVAECVDNIQAIIPLYTVGSEPQLVGVSGESETGSENKDLRNAFTSIFASEDGMVLGVEEIETVPIESFDLTSSTTSGMFEISTNTLKKSVYKADNQVFIYFNDVNQNGIKEEGEEILNNSSLNELGFSIKQVAETVDYNIIAGWNLIALPMVMDDDNTSKITKISELIKAMNVQGADITSAGTYRNGQFIMYSQRTNEAGEVIVFGDDFNVMPGEGYFVRSYKKTTVSLIGKKVSGSLEVEYIPGWNLVGIYNENVESYNAFELLDKMVANELNADAISKWDNGRYNTVVKSEGEEYGYDYKVFPTAGYFVRVSGEETKTFKPE